MPRPRHRILAATETWEDSASQFHPKQPYSFILAITLPSTVHSDNEVLTLARLSLVASSRPPVLSACAILPHLRLSKQERDFLEDLALEIFFPGFCASLPLY